MKPNKKKGLSLYKVNPDKQRICNSFERKFEETTQFNAYIEGQFQKMLQQKNQNPTLIIPHGFRKFIHTKSFKQLLRRIYEYMEILVQFEQKYEEIKQTQEQKIISNPLFKPMRYQSNILQQKCKQISYAYMGILLGYGDNKRIFKDQYFFETMIYFLTQILRQNFDPSHYKIVEQELNRIFRTNTFNLVKRRHLQDDLVEKNPSIKQSKYDGTAQSVTKLQARLSLQKKNHYSVQLRPQRASRLVKPIQMQLSTFHSIRRRSPLIASFYPSDRQKLFSFSKEVREKQAFFKPIYRYESQIQWTQRQSKYQ